MQKIRFFTQSIRWGSVAHLLMSIGVPLVVLLFVRLELAILAFIFVVASKWRVIAVQPRHWLANIRANSPDLIVNLSFIIFLMRAVDIGTIIFWVAFYIFWLVWIKPQSKEAIVGIQSLLTFLLGFTALFWLSDSLPEIVLVILAWLIAYSGGRHYFSHFEEPMLRVISLTWAFVVAQLAWLLNRWLIVYTVADDIVIPQLAIIITIIAYIGGSLYYLNYQEILRRHHVKQYIVTGCLVILAIIWLTDWSVVR